MKFFELFWSKEMKQLVEKYRKEGTLNEEAVRYFNNSVRGYLIIFIFISIFFLANSELIIGLTFLICCPLFVWFDLRNIFKNNMASYCFGKKIIATVTKVGGGLYGTRRIVVIGEDSKKHVIKLTRGAKTPDKKLPIEGDKVEVFIDEKGKYGSTLNMDYLTTIYSLKTRILKNDI
jgi:hypothetical protein